MDQRKKSSLQTSLFSNTNEGDYKLPMLNYLELNSQILFLRVLGFKTIDELKAGIVKEIISNYSSDNFGDHLFDWSSKTIDQRNTLKTQFNELIKQIPKIENLKFNLEILDVVSLSVTPQASCSIEVNKPFIDYDTSEEKKNELVWKTQHNMLLVKFFVILIEDFKNLGSSLRMIRNIKSKLEGESIKYKVLVMSPDARFTEILLKENIYFYHFNSKKMHYNFSIEYAPGEEDQRPVIRVTDHDSIKAAALWCKKNYIPIEYVEITEWKENSKRIPEPIATANLEECFISGFESIPINS